MPGSILIAYGAAYKPTLAQVGIQGGISPLGEFSSRIDSSDPPYLSPDGKWLAYSESDDHEDRMILYNFETHETQTISPSVGANVEGPVLDAAGERVAYAILADPAYQINGLYAWAIYVRTIATEVETLFGGPFLARPHERPLPGKPIAWVGDELLLNTLLYLGEDSNQGIWALDVNQAVPGEATSLQNYDRQVLSPEDLAPRLYHRPTISPGSDMLAFFIYDHDHEPSCLGDSWYEEGSTVALGVVPTTDGEPRVLVDVASVDSMLASPLTWSPDGQQILFAQGQCEDTSTLLRWTLRIVDLRGNIVGEWPLESIETTWWGAALWCSPDDMFYTRQRGELWHLNLVTGRNEQLLSDEWVRLIGCLP
jgi:hypothetical protein